MWRPLGPRGLPPFRRSAASRPRRRRLPLVVLIVLTLLAGGGTYVLYGTSLLDVRRVAVTGTRVLSEAEVRETAAVPLRRPLADVDIGAVEQRLRDRLRRIAEVRAVRAWPHTLRLEVTEREPVAVLRREGGFTEVDRDGVPYAEVAGVPDAVPVVELAVDRANHAQTAGLRHFGTRRLLRAAVQVAADLPEAVRARTTAVQVRSYDGIELRLSGGRTVVWGSSEHGEQKAKALTAVMRAAKDARRYDVSAPSAPAAGG